ncbi:MAG TPA: lysophospholipid acyltransferase family protein [Phenylobacterium sp.]|jgi:1-acyl-sn-glycerol-3-phosphate acyltransferase|uniref:lysophospholipid acyltransferase family protein n=1 Tax=Phenylobacterium sp. TaxID=1871053 RepID=UPI002CB1F3F3|nr:lysophospholipid acyltransferase family protein [Phenylobacterium sp.]HXA40661.1 lysophospholipid acyltransferase family protein [Phenylobacterium sp.]
MILIRSLAFAAVFYLWSIVSGLAMTLLLLAPRRWMIKAMGLWGVVVIAMLRLICGVRVEFRGLQHLPTGRGLVAAKHQCMFDTMAPLTVFPDACYVMKRELLKIPFYGWFSLKTGMLVLDRQGGAGALRKLIAEAKARLAEPRQLVIFPEGHRMPPGTRGEYQPGVAGLYRELGLPCTPMATNSGVHWPAHGILRRPGLIVYEFLEPIPPGLHRAAFMRELETRIETASQLLLNA